MCCHSNKAGQLKLQLLYTEPYYVSASVPNLYLEITTGMIFQQMRFWMCSGGLQKGALSLWISENSTGPEEQRILWHSASEPKSERGWKLIILPLYGLADWYGKNTWHFHHTTGSSDYIKAACLVCLNASNWYFYFEVLKSRSVMLLSSQQTSQTHQHKYLSAPTAKGSLQKLSFSLSTSHKCRFLTFPCRFFCITFPLNSTKLMNPIGTLVLQHGPAMCTVVQNIPFFLFHLSVIRRRNQYTRLYPLYLPSNQLWP